MNSMSKGPLSPFFAALLVGLSLSSTPMPGAAASPTPAASAPKSSFGISLEPVEPARPAPGAASSAAPAQGAASPVAPATRGAATPAPKAASSAAPTRIAASSAAPAQAAAPSPRPARDPDKPVATWEELVPDSWDPSKLLEDQQPGLIREGSATELVLMRKMRELWDTAPTRDDLAGAEARLPGYVVPLEREGDRLKEFLLVPYFGACIHTPPPPANQIVHVKLSKAASLRTMDAVWASGRLAIRRQDSQWGMSGYALEAGSIEPYQAQKP